MTGDVDLGTRGQVVDRRDQAGERGRDNRRVGAGQIDEVERRQPESAQIELDLLAAMGAIELGAGADVEAASALGSAYARGSVAAGLLLARE